MPSATSENGAGDLDRTLADGALVWSGRWEPRHSSIVADYGIGEIHDACRALNPTGCGPGTTGICVVI